MKSAWKSFAKILFGLGLVGSCIAFFYGLAYLTPLVAPAAIALMTLGISYAAFRSPDSSDSKPARRARRSRKVGVT